MTDKIIPITRAIFQGILLTLGITLLILGSKEVFYGFLGLFALISYSIWMAFSAKSGSANK